MAGMPKRRHARKVAAQAAALAEQRGIPIADALACIEAETGRTVQVAVAAEKPFFDVRSKAGNTPGISTGERKRQEVASARDRIGSLQSAWLIGTPAEILDAYDRDREYRGKITPEVFAKLLFLVRAGLPVKDSMFGPGIATLLAIAPATLWNFIHEFPEAKRQFYEARDASSEVIEDELRAMLPTAIKHPHLLESLEFIAGKLEFLARVRNKERYAPPPKSNVSAEQITFNINALPPRSPEAKTIDATVTRAAARRVASLPSQQSATVATVGDQVSTPPKKMRKLRTENPAHADA